MPCGTAAILARSNAARGGHHEPGCSKSCRTPAGDPADSCVMVIFGASGDLAKRKLVPALYNLARDKLLSQQFAVVGFATRDYTTETFRSPPR